MNRVRFATIFNLFLYRTTTVQSQVPEVKTSRVNKVDCCPGWKDRYAWIGCRRRKLTALDAQLKLREKDETLFTRIFFRIFLTVLYTAFWFILFQTDL